MLIIPKIVDMIALGECFLLVKIYKGEVMTYKDFIKKGNNLTNIDTKKRANPLKILLFILYKIGNL